MDYIRLGSTGLKVSRLCLGAMTYGTLEWRPWVLAWLLAKPGVTAPIIDASKLPHLDEAVAAVDIRLDAGELTLLEAPYQPHAILGHL